jgi:hypothetical protein
MEVCTFDLHPRALPGLMLGMRLHAALGILGLAPLLWATTGHTEEAPVVTRHALGGSLGLRGDLVRDDLLVPLAFAGPGLQLLASYRGWVGPGVLNARADLGAAIVFNRFGHPGLTVSYGALVDWTLTVLRATSWHISLGPALALDSRESAILSWDDAHGYWLGSQWLGPAARFMGQVSPAWRLEASAAVALAGFESRPPSYRYKKQEIRPAVGFFFTQPTQSEKLVLPDQLQIFRLELALRRAAYNRFDVGRGWVFGLDFRLASTTTPDTNINLSRA